MAEIEWIECDDPERLAVAAQAGLGVKASGFGDVIYGTDPSRTSESFRKGLDSGWTYRIPARAVWPPALTVPEGMTPERLREIAYESIDSIESSYDFGTMHSWADDLAAQIEGGGADDREASGPEAGVAPFASDRAYYTPALPDDPFPVGCRVRHSWRGVGVVTRPDRYDGTSRRSMLTAEFRGIAAEVYVRNLTRIDSEPDPASRLPGDLGQLLARYQGQGYRASKVSIQSEPLTRTADLLNDALGFILQVEAERDALAARLAAWPEVPDGCEVLVVPSEVVDAVRAARSERDFAQVWSETDIAARAAVARRPKPRVEPFKGRVIDAGGGEVRIVIDRDTMQYPPVGSRVEVLAEDGES